jgi:hypothetical protein
VPTSASTWLARSRELGGRTSSSSVANCGWIPFGGVELGVELPRLDSGGDQTQRLGTVTLPVGRGRRRREGTGERLRTEPHHDHPLRRTCPHFTLVSANLPARRLSSVDPRNRAGSTAEQRQTRLTAVEIDPLASGDGEG